MAISRMQMYRQLRAGGGIMNLAPREKFGLGSSLKKFVRNIIPNEVSEIAVKAAPFVAPFNPALAGAMAGIGSFDQTGRIGSSLKSGLLTYGGGQLARYIGGAGFQGNPFASGGAFTPSGFMGGFSSPLGTQTGLGKILADKGYIGTKTLPTDPSPAATDSIFVQPGEAGTYTYTDMPGSGGLDDIIRLEPGSVTPSGQIVSGTAAQNQAVLDQIAKQTVSGATDNIVQKVTQRGYGDLFKDIFSGDLNKSTSALKELGGKALKSIYTNKDGSVDKLAVASTIAGASSYIEARKLAKEAGLVDDEDQYTEAMYEADKARYSDYYSKILTPEAFGIRTQEADGGIISLRKMKQNGSVPEEFISYTDDNSAVIYYDPEGNPITKAEAMKAFDEMPLEDQILTDMEGKPLGPPKTRKRIMPMPKPKEMVFEGRMKRLMEAKGMLEPESFEYLLQELKDEMTDSGIPSIKLEKKATGGRVGYKYGTPVYLEDSILKDPRFTESMEGVDSLIDMLKSGIDKDKIMSFKEYQKAMDKYKKSEKTVGPFGDEVGEKLEKYDLETVKPSDRFPMEVLVANKMVEDKDKELSKIDEMYSKDMGVRKDAEKIFDSKEFKNWKADLLSKDPKRRLKAESNPKADYFDTIYFTMDRPGYMKDRYGYDMMSETEGSFKKGGRVQYAMGSEVPIRQNEAGTKELDYRQSGGFVPPIGIKEKADDIPAMLSNNEFVFTADAVRAAGGGSVNKGAQKMYALMKQLENKVV